MYIFTERITKNNEEKYIDRTVAEEKFYKNIKI
jgi:hypothetical protein